MVIVDPARSFETTGQKHCKRNVKTNIIYYFYIVSFIRGEI